MYIERLCDPWLILKAMTWFAVRTWLILTSSCSSTLESNRGSSSQEGTGHKEK